MRLLEFSASWCQPCKVQKPIVESWVKDRKDISLEIIDVDQPDGAALASKYMVMSVPTLVFANKDGKALAVNSGLAKAEKLNSLHEQAIKFEKAAR